MGTRGAFPPTDFRATPLVRAISENKVKISRICQLFSGRDLEFYNYISNGAH